MKASSAIGIAVACLGIAVGATMEGSPVMALLNIAGDAHRARRHLRRHDGRHELRQHQGDPGPLQEGLPVRPAGPQRPGHRARRLRREGAPRRPAGPRRAALRRWRTPSPRRACSSSSTAPTPSSSPRCSTPRTTRCASATSRAPSPSRRPAASPRPWASSARSSGSCTCSRTSTSPETLGPSISAAFIATLLGVASANVVFLPVANRLKQLSAEELHFRSMTLEGILAIQAGDNPRMVSEKLITYVPPSERPAEDAADEGAGAPARAAA